MFVSAVFLALIGTGSIAGTTGTLSVKVLDTNGAPIAAAKVSATAPSQTAFGVTDAGGFFGFVNLSPDTYAVVASKEGYAASSVYGVTVQADQTTSIQVVLSTQARLLGRVVTTGQAIVSKSVTSDVYAVNTQAISQYSGSVGGGETLNSQFGVISSLPGVVRTIGTGVGYYANNFISVRGGTPDQIGFELEGVPLNRAFDKYNGGSQAANGLASIELYTGGVGADAGHSMAGFVNGVIRRGSYPGGADFTGFVGAPSFNHSVQADAFGGSPNGRFTYFLSTLALNANYRYVNSSNLDNTSISIPANDPGCPYVNFINGSSLNCAMPQVINLPVSQAPLEVLSTTTASIRNTVANLHFSIEHGGLADDAQVLYMVDYTGSPFPYSGATIDPHLANASNAQGQIIWPSAMLYTGAEGQLFNPSAFKTLTWPSSGGGTGLVPQWYYDGQSTQQSVEKLGYTHLLTQSSFIRFYAYSLYSEWDFDQATNTLVGGIYYIQRNNSTGATATYQNQLSERHLLRADVDYEKQVGLRYSYSPGGGVKCGNLSTNTLGSCSVGMTVAQIGVPSHSWNNLPEVDSDIALSDKWHPSDQFLVELGARYDRFVQGLTPIVINGPNGIAEQSQNEFGTCLFGYRYPSTEPCFGYLNTLGGTAAPGMGAWQDVSGSLTFNAVSPRIGLTYTVDPANILRFSFGRYVESPNTAYQEYVGAPYWGAAGTVNALNNFYKNFAFLAVHNVQPEDSTNYDLSFEHQFMGGWALKLSPFYRITRNQILNAPANPLAPQLTTGFNFGAARIQGVEFLLGRNRTTPNGLNATIAATYNDAKIRFQRSLGGHSFIDAVNAAISAYNSAYSTHYALFDPNGYYSPSVTESPQFLTPSYDVRYVINAALDERFNGWDLTPTFNYQSGNPYGDPLGFPDIGGKAKYGPDPYTHTFDGFGTLKGPSWFTMNVALSRSLGANTTGTFLVTNVLTAVHNQGYPWEFPTKDQVLSYGDNNFFFGFPMSGKEFLGENYYPYAPFSLNPATQLTFGVSVKM